MKASLRRVALLGVLLALPRRRCAAGVPRRTGAGPARGRAGLLGEEAVQAGPRQLQHHRHGLLADRFGRRRAARDRALLARGRGEPRQGPRGLRPRREALPAERRRAGRLLLPRPAELTAAARRRPSSTTRSRSSGASSGSIRGATGCRARSTPPASRNARRAASPTPSRPSGASPSSTPRATWRPRPSSRSATASPCSASRSRRWRSSSRSATASPTASGRRSPSIASPRSTGSTAATKAAFARDPAYTVGAGDALKDVRAILMTPARTLWIASDKVKSAVPFEPDGARGRAWTPRTCGASRSRRAARSCWPRGRRSASAPRTSRRSRSRATSRARWRASTRSRRRS